MQQCVIVALSTGWHAARSQSETNSTSVALAESRSVDVSTHDAHMQCLMAFSIVLNCSTLDCLRCSSLECIELQHVVDLYILGGVVLQHCVIVALSTGWCAARSQSETKSTSVALAESRSVSVGPFDAHMQCPEHA